MTLDSWICNLRVHFFVEEKNNIFPLKSFYEKEGYLFNIEGRLRKFYKTITGPENARSIETIFATLMWEGLNETDYGQDRISTINWIWGFEDEIKISKRICKIANLFRIFNLIKRKSLILTKKLLFMISLWFRIYQS